MRIIEQTEERLVFRTGIPLLNASLCEFDRRVGRAVIKRKVVLWSRKAVDIQIADILSVGSSSVTNTIEDSDVSTAIPYIELTCGTRVNLSVITGDTKTAPKAVAAITSFLRL